LPHEQDPVSLSHPLFLLSIHVSMCLV
jgi:hypothetical protein